MRRMLAVVYLLGLAGFVAACSNAPVPANYYEDDIHHGYPGPGVSNPSAM